MGSELDEWVTGMDATSQIDRRGLFRGCAVMAALGGAGLAGCGGRGSDGAEGREIVIPVSEIPVGGGKVFASDKVVVTQPRSGEFQAFSAVCTHQGCTVGRVDNAVIVCPCHGSRYSIEDASVQAGPAPQPLHEYPVRVRGDRVVVG